MDLRNLSREQYLSVQNGFDKEEDEELDPRVMEELEKLNTCTDEINRLETQLDEANATFRSLLSDSTQHLKSLSKKLGSCIEKARPYFEGVDKMTRAQAECQRAAVQFHRASDTHTAAKETINLAEERFLNNSGNWQFDTAWQEMLNHATIKVIEAEKMKNASEKEHLDKRAVFSNVESIVKVLEKKLRKHIKKSKHYFHQKAIYNKALNSEKARVGALQAKINATKSQYTNSLKNLEDISESIHAKRKMAQSRLDNLEFDSLVYDLSNIHLRDQDTISTIATDTDLSSSDTEVRDSALGSTCFSISEDHGVEEVSKLSVDWECSSVVLSNKTRVDAEGISAFHDNNPPRDHNPLSRERSRDILGQSSSSSDNIESMHDAVIKLDQDGNNISSATTEQTSLEESSPLQEIFSLGHLVCSESDLVDGLDHNAMLNTKGSRIDPINPSMEADGNIGQEKNTQMTLDVTGNENEPVPTENEESGKPVKTTKVNPNKPFLTSNRVKLCKVQTSIKTTAKVDTKYKPVNQNTRKPTMKVIASVKAPLVGCASQQVLGFNKREQDKTVRTNSLVPGSKTATSKFATSSQAYLRKSVTAKPPTLPATKFRKRRSIGVKLPDNKTAVPANKTLGPKPNPHSVKSKALHPTSIKPKFVSLATNPPLLSVKTPQPRMDGRSPLSTLQTSVTEPKSRLTQSKSSSALQTPSMSRPPGLSRSSSVVSKSSQPRIVSTDGKRFTSSRKNDQESHDSVNNKSKPMMSSSTIPATNKSKVVLPSIKESVRKPLFRNVRDRDCNQEKAPTAAVAGRPGARRKPGNGI